MFGDRTTDKKDVNGKTELNFGEWNELVPLPALHGIV